MDIDPNSSVLFEDMEKPDFSVSPSPLRETSAPKVPLHLLVSPGPCVL